MSNAYSFVILTFNESIHLPRLLESIEKLNAPIYILDSGSTDDTLEIARRCNATIGHNKFENHPHQWEYALNHFDIQTPWTIGLDADQYLSPELFSLLVQFKNEGIPADVDGVYFNRKNYFKGKWIRHGGYFPKYMLKMFRTGKGISSLKEKMDHRFEVTGKTSIWKKGYLIEENLKENNIAFWIDKHNRYSDLVARDEYERTAQPLYVGELLVRSDPDRRIASQKKVWRKLPLVVRPFIYFTYRYFVQLGFLDGYRGFIFHFLHAFWFRLLVDIKIQELRSAQVLQQQPK